MIQNKKKGIVHDRWIKVKLGLMATSASLIKSKKRMQEYAEELGWIIKVDKEGKVYENGVRYYEIDTIPNEKGLISPEEYRKVEDRLLGFSQDLLLDISEDDEVVHTYSEDVIRLMGATKLEEVIFVITLGSTLTLEYPMQKRVELEKVEPHLAKLIFHRSVQELFDKTNLGTGFFNNFFQDKETIKVKKETKRKLKEWFGIQIKENYWFG